MQPPAGPALIHITTEGTPYLDFIDCGETNLRVDKVRAGKSCEMGR
jgi:hypothetical protein